jgi:hypothetical protein
MPFNNELRTWRYQDNLNILPIVVSNNLVPEINQLLVCLAKYRRWKALPMSRKLSVHFVSYKWLCVGNNRPKHQCPEQWITEVEVALRDLPKSNQCGLDVGMRNRELIKRQLFFPATLRHELQYLTAQLFAQAR